MTKTPNLPGAGHPRRAEGASPVEARPICPLCASPLVRIRRRLPDRLLSLIVPVQRYRCSGLKVEAGCPWEGCLRIHVTGDAKHVQHFFSNVSKKPGRLERLERYIDAHLSRLFHRKTARGKAHKLGPHAPTFTDISFADMAQITLDAIGDAVLVVDPDEKVIYLNRVAETLTGWSDESAIGRPVEEIFNIIDGSSRQKVGSPSHQAIKEDRVVDLALGSVLISRDGTGIEIEDSAAPIYNRRGEVAGAVIVFHDARQSQAEMEKMSHLAQHDALTGLPNRLLLKERLTQAIGMANRHNRQLALLFLDLDHFKPVNDSLGHAAGDKLLQEVATDIVACVRTTDTVSRHGGDEFVVLLTQIEEVNDAAQVAKKLLARIPHPRNIEGNDLEITLSIGISVYPANGPDADTLLCNADTAMYCAKESGRNNYQFYYNEPDTPRIRRALR